MLLNSSLPSNSSSLVKFGLSQPSPASSKGSLTLPALPRDDLLAAINAESESSTAMVEPGSCNAGASSAANDIKRVRPSSPNALEEPKNKSAKSASKSKSTVKSHSAKIYNSATLAGLRRSREPQAAQDLPEVQTIAAAIDDAVSVWDRFPPINYEDSSPVPNKIEYFACPEGASFAWSCVRPDPTYSSFILSGGGGSDEQYGKYLMTYIIASTS